MSDKFKTHILKSKKGITLLEIVLTVLIMSAGVVGIMEMAPSMLEIREKTDQMTTMTFLATRQIEEIKGVALQKFSDITSVPAAYFDPATDYPYRNYWRSVNVVDDTTNGYVKNIKVTIGYGSFESEDSYALYTKIAERT